MNSSHAHRTRFWYLLGVLLKISSNHPRHFYMAANADGFSPVVGGVKQREKILLRLQAGDAAKKSNATFTQFESWTLNCFWKREEPQSPSQPLFGSSHNVFHNVFFFNTCDRIAAVGSPRSLLPRWTCVRKLFLNSARHIAWPPSSPSLWEGKR